MQRVLPRFEPIEPTESFNGYLLRRAEMNLYESLHVVTNLVGAPTGTRSMTVVQKYVAELTELLEIDPKLAAQRISYVHNVGSASRVWMICGHNLGSSMVDVRRPKVCPQCLAEDPIIPLEWELTFFTVCPRHRRPLVEACISCGSKITWGRPHLARCKICNSSFFSSPGPASEHEAHLAEMISRKLHSHKGRFEFDQAPNALSRLSLNGLLSMALFIGGVTSDMKRVDPAHAARFPLTKRREFMKAASVAINDDWPKGLHKVFDHFISSEPLNCRTGEELFPGLYEAVVRRRRREGFQHIIPTA